MVKINNVILESKIVTFDFDNKLLILFVCPY